jgi:phytoene dehydrogenase-like protein
MDSDYDYWRKLSEDIKAYNEEKRKIADIIAERLDKRFPGLKNQIEAVDVVTPISVEHWTAAYCGYQAWPAPKEIAKEVSKNGVSKTLPGLQGFHMVGQWAGATASIPGVSLMGRNLVRQLCRNDRKEFVTTTAD